MKFLCCYSSRERIDIYWRTVWADNVYEAQSQGKRYNRKGYRIISVVQDI